MVDILRDPIKRVGSEATVRTEDPNDKAEDRHNCIHKSTGGKRSSLQKSKTIVKV